MWFVAFWRMFKRTRKGPPVGAAVQLQTISPPATGAASNDPGGGTRLRIRRRRLLVTQRGNSYSILLDNVPVAQVENGKTVDAEVSPGQHEVQVVLAEVTEPLVPDKLGHVFASHPVRCTIGSGEVAELMCGPGASAFFPVSRVDGLQKPDLMLKPKVPGASWRTYA